MIYLAKFNGRQVGAIGVTYRIHTYCYGDTKNAAELDLYTRFEHITGLDLEAKPDATEEELKGGCPYDREHVQRVFGDAYATSFNAHHDDLRAYKDAKNALDDWLDERGVAAPIRKVWLNYLFRLCQSQDRG